MSARVPLGARVAVYGVLGLFALYYLAPLYVMLGTSFKPLDEIRTGNLLALPVEWTLAPWMQAWSSACTGIACDGLRPFFFNSLVITVPAVLLSTMIGAFNGYVFAHWHFRHADVLFTALLVGCFIPFQAVILPMAQLLGLLGLANSSVALVFVHVVYGTTFTTLFFRNYYLGVPRELIKAARIDGAGFFLIFRAVVLPLSGPILVVCIVWQFTQIWNDFLFGAVFASGDSEPVTVALNNLVNTSTGVKEYNVNMAGALIAAGPTLLVYLAAGRYFVRGLTAGAVKG